MYAVRRACATTLLLVVTWNVRDSLLQYDIVLHFPNFESLVNIMGYEKIIDIVWLQFIYTKSEWKFIPAISNYGFEVGQM